jgi:hypothetical protein
MVTVMKLGSSNEMIERVRIWAFQFKTIVRFKMIMAFCGSKAYMLLNSDCHRQSKSQKLQKI